MCLDAMVFTKFFRSSGRVEISKGNKFQSMDLAVPPQNFFEGQFRFPIRIERSHRLCFINRNVLRRTENAAGRREDDFFNVDADHRVEKIEAVGDVIPKIFGRVLHRFADERAGGEMHDRIGPMLRQRFLDRLSILQIAFDELRARVDRGAMAFAEIIEDADLMAFVEQQLGANASDVASATDNENFHSRQNRRLAPLINPKCESRNSSRIAASKLAFSPKIGSSSKPPFSAI